MFFFHYGCYVRKLTKADFFETKGITLVQSAWTDSPAQAHKVVLTRIPAQTYEPISEDLCNRKIFGLTVSLQGFFTFWRCRLGARTQREQILKMYHHDPDHNVLKGVKFGSIFFQRCKFDRSALGN